MPNYAEIITWLSRATVFLCLVIVTGCGMALISVSILYMVALPILEMFFLTYMHKNKKLFEVFEKSIIIDEEVLAVVWLYSFSSLAILYNYLIVHIKYP